MWSPVGFAQQNDELDLPDGAGVGKYSVTEEVRALALEADATVGPRLAAALATARKQVLLTRVTVKNVTDAAVVPALLLELSGFDGDLAVDHAYDEGRLESALLKFI